MGGLARADARGSDRRGRVLTMWGRNSGIVALIINGSQMIDGHRVFRRRPHMGGSVVRMGIVAGRRSIGISPYVRMIDGPRVLCRRL